MFIFDSETHTQTHTDNSSQPLPVDTNDENHGGEMEGEQTNWPFPPPKSDEALHFDASQQHHVLCRCNANSDLRWNACYCVITIYNTKHTARLGALKRIWNQHNDTYLA